MTVTTRMERDSQDGGSVKIDLTGPDPRNATV
jgi:hypothetical protein